MARIGVPIRLKAAPLLDLNRCHTSFDFFFFVAKGAQE
jgi:hypothetical protein